MSGLLGMPEEKSNIVNMRASVQNGNSFPLKKVDLRNVSEIIGSPQKNNFKDSYMMNSPGPG
jgi:hypothetical protein